MIYEKPQDVQPLQVPKPDALDFGHKSPIRPLLADRAMLQRQLSQVEERAQQRKAEVRAEVEAARRGALVTSGSRVSDVAAAQGITAAAPAVLKSIDEEAQASSDALRGRLGNVDRNIRLAITPLFELIWSYNRVVNDYQSEVRRMSRADPGSSHAGWMTANELLAVLAVRGAYVAKEFERVSGQVYREQYGKLIHSRLDQLDRSSLLFGG